MEKVRFGKWVKVEQGVRYPMCVIVGDDYHEAAECFDLEAVDELIVSLLKAKEYLCGSEPK